MTMLNRCVIEWVKNLRYDIQYYDEVFVREMRPESVKASYENLWECSSEVVLPLNFGQVCRVSVAFNDSTENLRILPVVYECLDPEDLPEDVVMWKKHLRYSYCGEEEHFLETEDLIKDFENGTKPVESVTKPGTFPSPEEEEVPLRHNRSVRGERPKTYASLSTTKKEPLELKGVTRVEVGGDACIKVFKKHHLRICGNTLEDVDETGKIKPIWPNVVLKKGTKPIAKKEVEIMDTNKTVYRLYFDSQKDAKFFIEHEKSYHSTPSAMKTAGPFWQLRKLLKKRASRDILESKGIIKNEPIFGNTLEELCDAEHPVPEVVTKLVKLIEEPKNIVSVGIYRASANLAVLQNIRCEINLGKWEVLEQHRNDVDVLTGTLKLFFRELKEPLISHQTEQELRKVIIESSNTEQIREIVERLPPPNRCTFLFIIKHLLKVCEYKEQNKMDFHNIAVCWGPSMIPLSDNGGDIVVQTQEFTKITVGLLNYYSTTVPPPVETARKPDFIYEAIRKLTEIIEGHIEVEGIYRKSGSTPKIDKLMKSLEKQSMTDFNSKHDIHDLCCVLKKFVASIRTAIVPNEFFYRYLEICDNLDASKLSEEVRAMVNKLPRNDVIFLIFDHLYEVVQHGQKNKMSQGVLSDIWMTTLMAGVSPERYITNRPKYSQLFEIFMNLNQTQASNVGGAHKRKHWSTYDNVPEDIHNNSGIHDDVTKL